MSAERLRRADRLVDIKARAVDDALTELHQATEHVRVAVSAATVAEARWERALARVSTTSGCVSDIGELYAYVRSLRVQSDRAASGVIAARADEDDKRRAVTMARMEHRKLELWRAGLKAVERLQAERAERRSSDEIAARTVRKTG